MEESNAPISVEEARKREEALLAEETAKAEEAFRIASETGMSAMAQEMAARRELMGTPTLGRIVIYRSRTGNYNVPAIINCTMSEIYSPGVEAGHMPAISSDDRVHLTVFSAGLPGKRIEADDFVVTSDQPISENLAGCYQEWNIPFDPNGGPGTWSWPKRV